MNKHRTISNSSKIIYAALLSITMFVACDNSSNNGAGEIEKVVYDVVFRENLSGSFEKQKTGDQAYNYSYEYADRGRGPKFSEDVILNKENYIVSQHIKGNNYRKVSINEYFKSDGSSAYWKNSMSEGNEIFEGNKLYYRHAGSPAIFEIMAQLLQKSTNGKIDLFPEGEVELVNTIPLQLSSGLSVELMIIKGLNFDPTYIWMHQNQMICKISKNLHIIKKDLSDLRLEFKELQDEIEDRNLVDIAKQLTHDIDEVVVQDVNVFMSNGKVQANQDVFISDGMITNILPAGQKTVNKDAHIISGSGKTLMPGLFDMHTHNDKFRGILHLAGGVTSVRDLANNKQLKNLAEQFNSNEILGPRIVTFCGIIDGPGEFANQRNVVDNLEEALFEIQDYKNLGYEQIKLYSSIKTDWVEPLTAKAHELGMRVSGHIPAYMTATQAINQGYDEIQHINMLFLNFLSDTIDTRTPLRHTMPAQHGADLDLDSKEYLDFVDLLKTKDILVDPTVSIFENMYLSQKGQLSPTYSMIAKRFPLISQRAYYSGGLPKKGEQVQRYKDSFKKMLDVIYNLYEQGIRVVPGTDGLPGFLYHRELELYVEAGIPANEVLQLATIKSAEIVGLSDAYGSVAPGKKANLILIDGDPVNNISDIRKVEWTMKDGHMYFAKELYNSMGIQHYK